MSKIMQMNVIVSRYMIRQYENEKKITRKVNMQNIAK